MCGGSDGLVFCEHSVCPRNGSSLERAASVFCVLRTSDVCGCDVSYWVVVGFVKQFVMMQTI